MSNSETTATPVVEKPRFFSAARVKKAVGIIIVATVVTITVVAVAKKLNVDGTPAALEAANALS